MPYIPDWTDITIRLALSVLAGVLIGVNRSERGRPAGLRTTLLVCLAASLSMIQVNPLLVTRGKEHDSFSVLDMMRLPLGVLTGMGFIGAGAILKRGEMVVGVTTAATLWFVTIIGLCFGGGQIWLGLIGLVLGLLTLWGLKWVELHLHQDRRAQLIVSVTEGGPSEDDIQGRLQRGGCWFAAWGVHVKGDGESRRRIMSCDVRWRGLATDFRSPPFLHELAQLPGVRTLQWKTM